MNIDRIQSQFQAASARTYSFSNKNKEYPFPLLRIGSLQPGEYRCRLLWADRVKNPDGMHLVSTAKILQDNNTFKNFKVNGLKPHQEYSGLQRALDIIEERGLFEKMKTKPENKRTCEAIASFAPWSRYWMPLYIYAEERPATGGEGKGKYPTYVPATSPGAKPLDRVLEFNKELKMVEQLIHPEHGILRLYPDIDDPETGRDIFIIVQARKYTIRVGTPSPMSKELMAFADENYPNLADPTLDSEGKGKFKGLDYKFNFVAPELVESTIKATSWAKWLETWWAGQQARWVADPSTGWTKDHVTPLFLPHEAAQDDDLFGDKPTEQVGSDGDDWTDEELGDTEVVDDVGQGDPWNDSPAAPALTPPPTAAAPRVAAPPAAPPGKRPTPPPPARRV